MGRRISAMTLLPNNTPIEASRTYSVAGWASVNEGTEGPPIWDVVEDHLANHKSVTIAPNDAVKLAG
jgi:sulfur-oxidizing protein SoxB